MRKFIPLFVVVLAVVTFVAPTFAKGPSGPSGKSDTGHLYLNQKNPNGWVIIDDGAWGKLNYQADKFVFNGHKLSPSEEYTLINFARKEWEWPATVLCLGSGETDSDGNVHIMGAWDIAKLLPDTTPDTGLNEIKVWLVPSGDANCGGEIETLSGWHPAEILFEDVPLVVQE